MLIDWFTVIAQVVNFLILVWLMKRFLYTPILNAIDAREKRIAAGLAEAEAKLGEAQRERDEFSAKNEEFARQRDVLMREAVQGVEAERHGLLEEARQEAETLRAGLQEATCTDYRNLTEELRRRTRDEVFALARQTLADLAGAGLEEQMVAAFIRRCRALNEGEGEALQAAFMAAGSALVRSTYPLSADQRQTIELAARQVLGFRGEFRFATSPELVSGIALSVDGYEVAWSIDEYLKALKSHVGECLLGQSRPELRKTAMPGESPP